MNQGVGANNIDLGIDYWLTTASLEQPWPRSLLSMVATNQNIVIRNFASARQYALGIYHRIPDWFNETALLQVGSYNGEKESESSFGYLRMMHGHTSQNYKA